MNRFPLRPFVGLGLAFVSAGLAGAAEHARNVILFLGDAGGIPTLSAASLHGHGRPQALFIQSLPHLALMDTSSADAWMTDSAAAMSAIVTGRKTNSGVISQGPDAVPQKQDGTVLQTILEHAEARGLATGVITNTSIADATPAACYAHANYRKKTGEIFAQLATPRFGDGVDVVIGAGRKSVLDATAALGLDIEASLRTRGYTILADPAELTDATDRVLVLADDGEFDPLPVVERALKILSRNPRGYFLMVEWDLHATKPARGLKHVLQMDDLVRQTAGQVGADTLIIFAADHSFDLRVRGGQPGKPLVLAEASGQENASAANVRVEDSHTGEEVLVAAQGPGAERVHGFIANTELFRIMMAAFGWEQPAVPAP